MADVEFESAYETRYVGQLVSELAEARSEAALRFEADDKMMTLVEEKMFAKGWLRKALVALQEKRLAEGAPKLGEAALSSITQGVMDTAFSGRRLLRTWAEHPKAPNLTAQGTQEARLEQPDGTVVRLPPVASSIEEFRASVRACRALSTRPDAPWDHLNHELELVLNDGTRLTAIDFVVPIPFVTLRRPTLKIVTLDDLVANGTMSDRLGTFLTAAVQSKLRILVCGSMNSGKTVTLRALAAALPKDSSLVTAESSGELLLKDGAGDPYPYFITELVARRAGADGHGEVTLNTLIENAQRMSPTCVIVGEVRGPEAQALSKALRQGYQAMSTIHAISAVDGVANAALYLEEYAAVPAEAALKRMVGSVDLVIFMEQVRGKRIVAEVATPITAHGGVVQSEIIYDGTVMYPTPEVLKKKFARFGFGDDF